MLEVSLNLERVLDTGIILGPPLAVPNFIIDYLFGPTVPTMTSSESNICDTSSPIIQHAREPDMGSTWGRHGVDLAAPFGPKRAHNTVSLILDEFLTELV